MKVGLLTWWRTTNYGAQLQALATASYLRELGCETTLIDYQQFAERVPTMACPWTYLGFKGSYGTPLKKFIKGVVRLLFEPCVCGSLWRIHTTKVFTRQFLGFPSVRFQTYDDMVDRMDLPMVVVGSDQLWAPHFMDQQGSYLLGRLPTRIERISFATSLSAENFLFEGEDFSELFRRALPLFKAVSVRERRLIPQLESFYGHDIFWSVDPTLCYDADGWNHLLRLGESHKKVTLKDHITIYWLSDIRPHFDAMLAFAREQDKPVHLFTDHSTLRIRANATLSQVVAYLIMRVKLAFARNVTVFKAANARDFIEDLSTSSGVVSDSFHALMFSTVYKKTIKLVVPESRKSMRSRMEDFLKRVGWEGVIVPSFPKGVLSDPSATVTGSRNTLNIWINESKEWLKNALYSEGVKRG